MARDEWMYEPSSESHSDATPYWLLDGRAKLSRRAFLGVLFSLLPRGQPAQTPERWREQGEDPKEIATRPSTTYSPRPL